MLDVDTFLTALYVMVDDFCRSRPQKERPCGPDASLSPSERKEAGLPEKGFCLRKLALAAHETRRLQWQVVRWEVRYPSARQASRWVVDSRRILGS